MKNIRFVSIVLLSLCLYGTQSYSNTLTEKFLGNVAKDIGKSLSNKVSEMVKAPHSSANQNYCELHLKYGEPSIADNNNIKICRKGYALIFNTFTKTPLWVAERLTKEQVYGQGVRQLQFTQDPDIAYNKQASKSDYTRSGYDQGHMAPAADFSQDQQMMDESFYYSNIVPQDPDNNRHIWAALEKRVRNWLINRNELYIVTGPIFINMKVNSTIGYSKIAVPDALFKIVFDPDTKNAIAFMMPNKSLDEKDLTQYIVSVRDVEMATGLNFHNLLPVNVQEQFETRRSGIWKR